MEFERQPLLGGELLQLRPLRPGDFDELFAAASDPLVWAQHPDRDRWQRPVFENYFRGAIESGSAFAIIERQTGRIIGSSRYTHLREGEEVEIGWTFLTREFWGGLYNRELKTLMLEHAFRFVPRVLFVIGENNLRSRRAIEKIGGQFLRLEPAPESGATARQNAIYAITRTNARE